MKGFRIDVLEGLSIVKSEEQAVRIEIKEFYSSINIYLILQNFKMPYKGSQRLEGERSPVHLPFQVYTTLFHGLPLISISSVQYSYAGLESQY